MILMTNSLLSNVFKRSFFPALVIALMFTAMPNAVAGKSTKVLGKILGPTGIQGLLRPKWPKHAVLW